MTVAQAAEKWGITTRRVQEIIRKGKIEEKYRKQMYLIGKAWVMPADTPKPPDLRKTRYSKNK
jgi:hypothetical protein